MGKLATILMMPILLRGPASWGASGEENPVGFPQLMVILGVVFLLGLLAGVVIWRVRRTRQK